MVVTRSIVSFLGSDPESGLHKRQMGLGRKGEVSSLVPNKLCIESQPLDMRPSHHMFICFEYLSSSEEMLSSYIFLVAGITV